MKHNKGKIDQNSYCMLLKKCKEKVLCDFCEETFDNRYSNIIHNGHHIVIPLLKQELHQCEECLYYFQSVDGLVKHLLAKHNRGTLQETKYKRSRHNPSTSVKSKKEYEIIDISDDEPSEKTAIKKKVSNSLIIEKLSATKEIKHKDTPLVTSLKRKSEINGCIDTKHEAMFNTWNVAIDKKVTGCNLYDAMIDIKSDEYILPDVYYDVKISPNTDSSFTNSQPSVENTQSISSVTHAIPQNNCGMSPTLNEGRGFSVHYNELTQPCNYKCKLCHNVNVFPNRYALTLHQLSHLEISDIIPSLCHVCNKYFTSNDLKTHIKEQHWNVQKSCIAMTCIICNFKICSYKKHLFDYHHNLFIWGPGVWSSKNKFYYGNFTLKNAFYISDDCDSEVVDLCFYCFTNLTISNVKCRIISRCIKKGCLLKCSKCKKEILEINFVEKWKPTFVSKFKFEEDVKKKKKKTNEERLKNIQMRLKMINKLSRFYVWF